METATGEVTRTQDEIVAKMAAVKDMDCFGFMTSDLLGWMDYDHAKKFLKEGVTAASWSDVFVEPTRETILGQMEKYMSFAWDKANDCRGISAERSMDHYTIWIWMLGDEAKFGDLEDYEYYGKDYLCAICEEYGWDASQWDDGERTNTDC